MKLSKIFIFVFLVLFLNGCESVKIGEYSCDGCNVVLINIDTLRADHLPCYGYEKNTAPNICAFAEENVLFENHYSQAAWTGASVASLFTSLYVSQHKLIKVNDTLGERAVTMAELFSNEGYYTKSIFRNQYLESEFGMGQGFDDYVNVPPGKQADEITKLFLEFLKDDVKSYDKFFVYLHYLDPHDPYEYFWDEEVSCNVSYGDHTLTMPLEDGSQYYDFREWLDQGNSIEKSQLTDCVVPFYDGDIRYVDEYVGKVIDKLKEDDFYNNTVIIITADHGEEFMEHGGISHSRTTYGELIHVPLLIHFPESKFNGRIETYVESIDVLPTLLDYLNVPGHNQYDLRGESLINILNPEKDYMKDIVISEVPHKKGRAIIKEGHKLIIKKKIFELYNLIKDPQEKKVLNLDLDENKVILEDLLSKLNQIPDVFLQQKEVEIDEETARELRSLGYLG